MSVYNVGVAGITGAKEMSDGVLIQHGSGTYNFVLE